MKSIFVFFIEVFKYDLSKYSGYFLIGYWIFKNKDKLLKIKTTTLIILLVCIILGSWYIGLQHALHTNEPSTLLYDNFMIFIFEIHLNIRILLCFNQTTFMIYTIFKFRIRNIIFI